MAKGRKDRSGTKREGPFGPYVPMRGAFGQALAVMEKVHRPVSPTEAHLQPAGKSYELTYSGSQKLRDWD